ncbi:hypothetical protein D3C76_1155250 [compost metagenome]
MGCLKIKLGRERSLFVCHSSRVGGINSLRTLLSKATSNPGKGGVKARHHHHLLKRRGVFLYRGKSLREAAIDSTRKSQDLLGKCPGRSNRLIEFTNEASERVSKRR